MMAVMDTRHIGIYRRYEKNAHELWVRLFCISTSSMESEGERKVPSSAKTRPKEISDRAKYHGN